MTKVVDKANSISKTLAHAISEAKLAAGVPKGQYPNMDDHNWAEAEQIVMTALYYATDGDVGA